MNFFICIIYMPKRNTMKRRSTMKRKMKGGGENCGCDKDVKPNSFFSGGGNRRRRKYRNKSKKGKKSLKKRKSRKSLKGGAINGYDMLSLSGLESSAVPLKRHVLKGQTYSSGNPLDQPLNYKYGSHHPPLV